MAANDTTAGYGTWILPGTRFTVTYPLPLFHEIDFLVNEAYRRIPYGGIEMGGLLFGHLEESSARIEALRLIECEHASGPSFMLSDRDIAQLRQQLTTASSHPELGGMTVLGWFISHSRSELHLTEHEDAVFRALFPEPGRLTLLVKPERFRPTRFSFIVRNKDGSVERDATRDAFILPLPGRADRKKATDAITSVVEREGSTLEESLHRPVAPIEQSRPETMKRELPNNADSETLLPRGDEDDAMRVDSARLSSLVAREAPPAGSPDAAGTSRTLKPLKEIRKTRSLEARRTSRDARERESGIPVAAAEKRVNFRLASALLIAAVLGCALGYWAYELLSPSPIPLTIEPRASSLLVSWPAGETRDTDFAALRIDDGSPTPLTPGQKATGQAEIDIDRDNLKVELIVQHRMGDARGIVRYVRAQRTR